MTEEAGRKRARLSRTTVAATVIAVLALLMVSAVFIGGSGSNRGASPDLGNSHLTPAALPNTVIDLNESQSAGTYVYEYVTLNNLTTLTKLPVSLTVTAAACDWVIVANDTSAAIPASIFHNVQFHNITSGNNTGNLADKGTGFKICGGGSVWLNYAYWTYSIYEFRAAGLGINGTIGVTFGDWPGLTGGPSNVSAPFSNNYAFSLKVASNLSFVVTLPKTISSPTTCDATGQICSFTRYSLVASADTLNTTAASVIAFNATTSYRVTGAYENWTVGYSATTVQANTGLGGFFSDTSSFFQTVFVQFWYLWVLVLLGIGLVAAVAANRKGRGRR